LLDAAVEVLAESALAGGTRVFADGVYSAEPVSALEPAEDDPEDANEEEAPAPLAPVDVPDWMYSWFSLWGPSEIAARLSSTTWY
jgi:hypothetical protein